MSTVHRALLIVLQNCRIILKLIKTKAPGSEDQFVCRTNFREEGCAAQLVLLVY